FFNQMRNHFRVGFCRKFVAFFNQLFLERQVIFNNAVMDDNDFAGAVAMRMRVFFRRAAVRGPARMPDSVGAFHGLETDPLFQIAQLAFRATKLQRAIAIAAIFSASSFIHASVHSNAGRVISTILKLAQPLNNYRNHALFTYITNDSTHNLKILSVAKSFYTDTANPLSS